MFLVSTNNTEETTIQLTCALSRLASVREQIADLNKRAAKCGAGGIDSVVHIATERYVLESQASGERRRWYAYRAILELTGRVPKVEGGWLFTARIEHHGVGNLVTRSPFGDAELDPRWRTAGPDCAHCGYKRARNVTYVLTNEAGATTQVGSTCIDDFTRGEDIEWLLSLWELVDRAGDGEDEWGGGGGHYEREVEPLEFMAYVVTCARMHGYFGSQSEHPTKATASRAIHMMPRNDEDREWKNAHRPTDADREQAAVVTEWARGKAAAEQSDYWWNVRIVLETGVVNGRREGLWTSVLGSWRKEQEIRNERAVRPVAKHWGEVGKRVTVRATVARMHHYETDYGTKTIVALVLEDGTQLTWFASGVPQLDVGKTYEGKLTVKKHDEYKGEAQTIVARATLKVAA